MSYSFLTMVTCLILYLFTCYCMWLCFINFSLLYYTWIVLLFRYPIRYLWCLFCVFVLVVGFIVFCCVSLIVVLFASLLFLCCICDIVCHVMFFFFLMIWLPPISTLLPSTPLFCSPGYQPFSSLQGSSLASTASLPSQTTLR